MASIRQIAPRTLLLALLWILFAKGEPLSWVVGVPTVIFASAVGTWLSAGTPWRWRMNGFLRFVPLFAYYSLKGGIDVAGRAFNPRLPLAPGMVNYQLRLPEGTARVFFANIVSLLPGTLSADLTGGTLVVHVLDTRLPVSEQLLRIEAAVAELFGCTVHPRKAGTRALV
jgi:multicomponent Na+:H+ antiporter subunit E